MRSRLPKSFWPLIAVSLLNSGLFFAPTSRAEVAIAQPAPNEVQFLATARESMQARVDLIMNGGPHQFDVATYTLKDDNVGLGMLAAAVRNVRLGGRSRVAFDAYESKVAPVILDYVVSQGVEVKIFHPIVNDLRRPLATLRSWAGMNNRNHSKVVIVDSISAALGSSNLSTDYYLGARARETRFEWKFKDREMLIHGPAVHEIQSKFDNEWQGQNLKSFFKGESGATAAELEIQAERIENMIATLEAMKNTKPFSNPVVTLDQPIMYAADTLHYVWKSQDVHRGIIDLIHSAKTSLVLENPYIVLSEDFFNAIKLARERGVRVILYTNDPNGTDGGDVGAASVPDFERLAKIGVEINFFTLSYVFHGKTVAADGARFFWGSYNFDLRSKRFNIENGIFFTSRTLFQQLSQRRQQEGFREQKISVRGNVLSVEPKILTCEEVFGLSPKAYTTKLGIKLRLKRELL